LCPTLLATFPTRRSSDLGARPLAVTDCLNFANPDRPEVYWELEEAIAGLAYACRALDVPIVSGNVSLYNDSNGESAIYPTPVVGARKGTRLNSSHEWI